MQVRLKEDYQHHNIQFIRGEKPDLPQQLAQKLIAEGKAVEIVKAERAVLPNRGR